MESGGSFLLDVDTSGYATGGILSKYQNNEEKVIAYGSHTLKPVQQNYCTTKRELYGMVYFVQHSRNFLLGREFILRVDHKPLLWLSNFREPSGILARWMSILGAYDNDIVEQLVQEVFLKLGVPAQLHTDQGQNFESDLFKAICDLLGVEKTRTVPYNPKYDGMTERFNRTLVTMLSMFVDENKTDWDDHLPYVMAAYRATQHKRPGVTVMSFICGFVTTGKNTCLLL